MNETLIPLNRPALVGKELEYVQMALRSNHREGNGPFTYKCQKWLENWLGGGCALLTQSCTVALEMAAILANLNSGDEVIMPSYTFVSTANAFVLRGAVPVYVDINPVTQNIDIKSVERAITPKTRAIIAVHYAGIGCDMARLCEIADREGLLLIEDAAQAIMSRYSDRPLGSFGALATFSFHDTKNISSGEGGALIINDPAMVERAKILWDKGTNRSQYMHGFSDKYSWYDVGSSFLPSEITAAFLFAQLEMAKEITSARQDIWNTYLQEFDRFRKIVILPKLSKELYSNGHIFYLILPNLNDRNFFIQEMKKVGVTTPFHYVPLHKSPAGLRFGRIAEQLVHTDFTSDGLVRLPVFPSMSKMEMYKVIYHASELLKKIKPSCAINIDMHI